MHADVGLFISRNSSYTDALLGDSISASILGWSTLIWMKAYNLSNDSLLYNIMKIIIIDVW